MWRGDDTLRDFEGDTVLRGGAGDDLILSANGRNTLRGEAGNDVLVGNGGHNRMVGGADADAFVFLFGGTEQPDTWHGAIMDFEQGVDKLWMSPTGNSTYDAGDAYALFAEHAQQRGDNVVLRDGDWRLVIRDADLNDFSVDDFVDGAQGISIDQWADSLG